MTAFEFLLSKIASKIDDRYYCNQQDITEYVQQSKEMEKQQIIDAYNNGDLRSADLYYDETYGSKGSDEEKTNSQRFDEFMQLVTSFQTTSDKWKEYQDWLNEVPQISDEEIEKFIEENYKPNYIRIFVWEGIKWYREQLKKRQ